MKRVLFSMVLLLVASFTFAQEKNVKAVSYTHLTLPTTSRV